VEPKVVGKPLTEEEYQKSRDKITCRLPGTDFGPFMKKLQENIEKNWKVESTETRRVVLTFKIASKGDISELKIVKSSGFADFDQKAFDAIKKSKLIPLPDDAGTDVLIQYTLGAPYPKRERRL